ncbi:AsmA-like C-terminal region-containing protein [Terriglobus sp.]|uniref:AsmA-like C-terminal region-containing protein n=1 Tax=Terriglobus sp. TaxID=1889013 RepID=UPI003AFFEFF2
MVRGRLLQTFQQRFHSPATIDDLRVHYTGQIQVDGRGLRVQSVLTGVPGDPQHPMLQVQEFHFHLSILAALSRSPRIHHVRIRGVQLDLPAAAAQASHATEPDREVDLEYAEVDDAHIRFASSAADRAPLTFDLPHLVFRGVSRSRPIRFHAVVDNGPPLGISETDGTIGPWNFDDPRLTPLQGAFTFKDKDVSSVRGLHGRLSLDGHYQGTVANMHAEGTTNDPAFALDVSSHPVTLRTKFAMTLLPAQNAVSLERVEGSFGNTIFLCHGTAVKDRTADSFRLDVQLDTAGARVEDALALATHTTPPVMRGALSLTGRLQMRAGPESVSRKLSLGGGTFAISGGTFSNPGVQQTFDELAERAQGNPKHATAQRAASVTAAARGTVTMRNAVLRFPQVHVTSPGSQATLHGTYSLDGTQFVFDGSVHTEAKLSNMTSGLKSALLKPFNGLFGHGDHGGSGGATLPLHIQGVGGVPHLNTHIAGFRMNAPGTD